MESKRLVEKDPELNKDDLIVVGGAGGLIGRALVRYFKNKGFNRIRGADKKPLPEWYQRVPGVECLNLDLSHDENCRLFLGVQKSGRLLLQFHQLGMSQLSCDFDGKDPL